MGEKLPTTRQEAIDLLKTQEILTQTQKDAIALLFETEVDDDMWCESTEWEESWASSEDC